MVLYFLFTGKNPFVALTVVPGGAQWAATRGTSGNIERHRGGRDERVLQPRHRVGAFKAGGGG